MMHRDEAPALNGTTLGALLHHLNPVMRAVLDSPLHPILSRWFVLLRWVGPRTGQPRSIPVSYVSEHGHLYATTGDKWWHNLVQAPSVMVILRGSSRSASVVPIEESGESAAEHQLLFRRHPFFRRLAGIPASHGDPDPAAVRRSVDAGRTLLRIDIPERRAASRARGTSL
jgi:hypothetical protein